MYSCAREWDENFILRYTLHICLQDNQWKTKDRQSSIAHQWTSWKRRRLVSTTDPLINSMQILWGSFSTASFKQYSMSSIKTPTRGTRHWKHSILRTRYKYSEYTITNHFAHEHSWETEFYNKLFPFRSTEYRFSSVHWHKIKHNPKLTRYTTNYINIMIYSFSNCAFDFHGLLWLRKNKNCFWCEGGGGGVGLYWFPMTGWRQRFKVGNYVITWIPNHDAARRSPCSSQTLHIRHTKYISTWYFIRM